METKICSKCGRELPLSEFYKAKNYKDGHNSWCKECFKEYNKQNYREKKDEIKQYYQDNKEVILEQQKKYYQDNKEVILEQQKKYYQENREKKNQYKQKYRLTPIGRAIHLVDNYRHSDKIYNRGECTITPEWVIDNIFTQPCHWCGETDWTKLGCDRIDNSKPHTPDNVIPCCEECNVKRRSKTYEEYSLMI